MGRHPIDVALTYASEQEVYVEAVATELRQRGWKVFFLPWEKVKVWGEDLIPFLERVFREQATLCVMFISEAYVRKAWPNYERQAALARQLEQQSTYILPVRFDDSPVPGLGATIMYLESKAYSPQELAAAIGEKLETALAGTTPSAV